MLFKKVKKLENATYTFKSSTDFVGAISSGLCLVHCLFTPLLFTIQACSSSCSEISPLWWKMVDFLFLVISLLAIIHTARHSSSKYIPQLLYTNWILLTLIIVNNFISIIIIPHALIYIPAISLIVLHLYNRKFCQCNEESCCVS